MGIPISTPEEFKDRHRFSIGLLVYIFAVGAGFGAGVAMFNYALAEINGVRKDYEHDRDILNERIEAVDNRIKRMIENHNENKKAHK